MRQNGFEAENQADLGYGQLLGIIWQRRLWFLGTMCGVLAIAIPLALLKKPVYQSSMQLLLESNYQNKRSQGGGNGIDFTDSNYELDYATQQNLMRSSAILQRAVDKLNAEYPDLTVKELQEYIKVYQVLNQGENGPVGTKIIQVDYLGDDPNKTQRVLEVIERVYQEYNLAQQGKKLKEGLSFINQEIPEARKNLLEAEAALKQFRVAQNLIEPEGEANTVAQTLKEVQQERESLQAQYKETQGRYQEIQKQIGLLQERALISSRLSESSRYQNLLNEIQQTDLELKEQRTRFTDSNPVIQNLIEKRQNQQALLEAEAKRVLGEIPPQVNPSINALQKEGQLGNTDLSLANNLAEAQATLESIQYRDRALASTEEKLRQQLNRFPNLIEQYNSLLQEVEVKRGTLQKLLEARQDLGIELNRGGFSWQVVEAPNLGFQIAPNRQQDILLGGVVALFLGSVTAFAREALDDKVYNSDQLKEKTSFPLLGTTPSLSSATNEGFLINLPFASSPEASGSIQQVIQWQPFRDALDLVYENIQLLNAGLAFKSLAITSALAGEGKSTLVLGLALSAARRRKRVLIIDANLRRPSLHHELNLPNELGFSSLLANEVATPALKQVNLFDSPIDILTAGSVPRDPIKLLSSPRLDKIIKQFEQAYDLVLLDTPPVVGMVDAIQTASFCSGTIMVVRFDRTTASALSEATSLLSQLNILGLVANGARDLKRAEPKSNLLPGAFSLTKANRYLKEHKS